MARRPLVLILLVALFSATVVVAGAGPASAAACTGRITNASRDSLSRDMTAAALTVNGKAFLVEPGQTLTGGFANPVNGFWIPHTATIVYRRMSDGNYLTTHYSVAPGGYRIDTCHWATVTM